MGNNIKNIDIFIGSQLNKIERFRLENFFLQLNQDSILHYNIRYRPFICENAEQIATLEGKQESYNKILRNSQLCIFMFFEKVGDKTREELNVAFECLKNPNEKNPDILIFFKDIDSLKNVDHIEITEKNLKDLESLKEYIGGEEINHYYSIFTDIEKIILECYNYISNHILNPNYEYISIGREKANMLYIKGTNFSLNLDNIELIKNNRIYQEEKGNCNRINQLLINDDISEIDRFKYLIESKKSVETILSIIKDSFSLMTAIRSIEDNKLAQKINDLIEKGKKDEAIKELQKCNGNVEDYIKAVNESNDNLLSCLWKLNCELELWKSLYNHEDRIENIDRIYKDISKVFDNILEKKLGLSFELDKYLYDYALYQLEHKRTKEAKKYFSKLNKSLKSFINEDEEASNDENEPYENMLAYSYNKYAICLDEENEDDKAEYYYKEALGLREKLSEKYDFDNTYKELIIQSNINLAILYQKKDNFDEAKKCLDAAIEYCHKINNYSLESRVAIQNAHNSYGIWFYEKRDVDSLEKAKEYFEQSKRILDDIDKEEDIEIYFHRLSGYYENISLVFIEQKKWDDAANILAKAKEQANMLVKIDKIKFSDDVLRLYSVFCKLYYKKALFDKNNNDNYEKISTYCKTAIDFYKEISNNSIRLEERYNKLLFYNAFSNVMLDKLDEAKEDIDKLLVMVNGKKCSNHNSFCSQIYEVYALYLDAINNDASDAYKNAYEYAKERYENSRNHYALTCGYVGAKYAKYMIKKDKDIAQDIIRYITNIIEENGTYYDFSLIKEILNELKEI